MSADPKNRHGELEQLKAQGQEPGQMHACGASVAGGQTVEILGILRSNFRTRMFGGTTNYAMAGRSK